LEFSAEQGAWVRSFLGAKDSKVGVLSFILSVKGHSEGKEGRWSPCLQDHLH
jgi:hypothetical protein